MTHEQDISADPHAAESPPDPHESPAVWVPRLERLLVRQRDAYAELERLSSEQSACVGRGDMDRLLGLLSDRQEVVQAVVERNQLLEPYVARWPRLAEMLSSDDRERLRGHLDALERLVASISERDEADRRELESRRAAVASELDGLGRSRAALAAYQAPPARGPRYQDRSG